MHVPRLAIISTHPIQYYAPIFTALAASRVVQPRVFYTWSQTESGAVSDAGFGRSVRWDVPLLEGYEFEFVPNVARRPHTNHFWGLQNPTLIRRIVQWQPEALLIFGWNFVSHLGALRHFHGRVPVFFRGDSTLLNNRSDLRTRARHALLRWVYRHVDVAIAVGSNNRDYFRWCGIPDGRIAFAPHAIDTVRFDDPDGIHEARAAEQLRHLGIATGERVLLFAGKFIPEKDPRLLLEAFMQSEVPGHLILVGNGPLERELRELCGARHNVHFLPFQNQRAMPSVYRLGSAYILPSRSETWCLALNEAMACGRPVIASTRVGASRDLVKDGVTGWTFGSGNRQQLRAVIREALTSPAPLIEEMGLAARAESSRWSIQAAAAGIERSVIDFIGRRRSAA